MGAAMLMAGLGLSAATTAAEAPSGIMSPMAKVSPVAEEKPVQAEATKRAPRDISKATPKTTQLAVKEKAAVDKAVKNKKEDGPKRHGIWTALGGTSLRKTDVDGDFDGTVVTGTFGVDRWVFPKILLGATVGFEKTALEIGYNNGSVDAFGKTLALYGGYMIMPWLIADANYSYSWIDYDFIANANVNSNTDARRWTGAANLTAIYVTGPFGINASVGYLAFDELKDDATDSTTRFVPGSFLAQRQVNAGMGANYSFVVDKANVTLNADAKFGYDVVRPSGSPTGAFGSNAISTVDPSSVVFGIGFDVATQNNDATVSFKANTTQFQENTESYGFSVSARLAF